MKLKTIAAASLVALTTLSSQAASTNWGAHDQLESAFVLPSAGLFFDTFTFSLGAQSTVVSSVGSVGIGSGLYGLFSLGGDGLIGTADDVGFGAWNFNGQPVNHSVQLGAGNYYYSVFGVAAASAAYAISSSAAVTAVPEPETYALLGAGLGIIGFVASRRRRDDR